MAINVLPCEHQGKNCLSADSFRRQGVISYGSGERKDVASWRLAFDSWRVFYVQRLDSHFQSWPGLVQVDQQTSFLNGQSPGLIFMHMTHQVESLRSSCREYIPFSWCLWRDHCFLWNSLDIVCKNISGKQACCIYIADTQRESFPLRWPLHSVSLRHTAKRSWLPSAELMLLALRNYCSVSASGNNNNNNGTL